MTSKRLERTALLAGNEMMTFLAQCRVIVFGVGGVGSWCAEALARTGIGHLTLVDSDTVAESNINRQLPALVNTIGRPKVEVMKEHIALINPDCTIETRCERYTPESAQTFDIDSYDYVVDAIDSLPDKIDLILRCTNPDTAPRRGFYSSMGAARKTNPAMVSDAEFFKATGCPLARALRTRFRRSGIFPKRKFRVVFSPEQPLPQPADAGANGTFVHLTATFGLRLASLLINDIYKTSHCR